MRRAIRAAEAGILAVALAVGASALAASDGSRSTTAADLVDHGVELAARGELDQAIAQYDAALGSSPDFIPALFDRGNAHRLRFERARSLHDPAPARTGPTDDILALADYARVLGLQPKFAAAYVNRAVVWYERGEFAKAIADCDAAIALDPTLAEAWNNRSLAWYRSGDYARAKADFDQTIKLHQFYGNAMIMRSVADIPG